MSFTKKSTPRVVLVLETMWYSVGKCVVNKKTQRRIPISWVLCTWGLMMMTKHCIYKSSLSDFVLSRDVKRHLKVHRITFIGLLEVFRLLFVYFLSSGRLFCIPIGFSRDMCCKIFCWYFRVSLISRLSRWALFRFIQHYLAIGLWCYFAMSQPMVFRNVSKLVWQWDSVE